MALTSHNHHIPGTIRSSIPKPGSVEHCGGPGLCVVCSQETSEVAARDMESIYGRPYSPPENRK